MKTEIQQQNLPAEWSAVELGELLERITNGLTCVQEKEPPGIPVTRIETISNGVVDFERVRYVRDLDEAKKARFILQRGDILFSHINSDLHLGKTAVVTTDKPLLHGMNLLLLRTKKERLDPYYLHYLLNYYRRCGAFMAIAQHAVNQSSLNQKKINSLKVPLAPLDQQKRIVSEIEKQFSRLDEAVSNLKRVKANLKRYKAAVLKAAVEGKLTEVWRNQHPNTEPANELLQRILAERRAKWEQAEFAKMQAKSKTPKDDAWKKKYPESAALDTTVLPELPAGWGWARLDAIAALKGGITVDSRRKDLTARSVPYLRVANVQRGYIDLAEVKYIEAPESEIEALRLLRGDILFNEGGDRDKLGRGWIWESQLADCIHQNHVFRARLYLDQLSPKLVSWWGNSFGKHYFSREGKQTTNLASINLTKLSAFPVPIPPTAEQQEIVAEVDRRLSLVDEAEAQVNANLQRANRLRQAILTQAFTSKLLSHCLKNIA